MTVMRKSFSSANLAGFVSPFADPQQVVEAYFKASTAGFAICDRNLRCQAINQAMAKMSGYAARDHLGKTLREIVGRAPQIERAMRQVFRTGRPVLNLEVELTLPTRTEPGYWIANYFPVTDSSGRVIQIGAVVIEVTEQKKLEQSLRSLSGRLLRIRDDERRRLARELHDSLNQNQAAVRVNLRLLSRRHFPAQRQASILSQSLELLDDCIDETSNMSHLLHPPMLEKLGLVSAVKWFVKGFAQRTGIRVNLHLARSLGRLPAEVEIALFRVLQEAMSNIHRHARTRTAEIRLIRRGSAVILRIRDHGRGIPAARLRRLQQAANGGLGLISMRERIHELKGRWEIRSGRRGTEVEVELPLLRASSNAGAQRRWNASRKLRSG